MPEPGSPNKFVKYNRHNPTPLFGPRLETRSGAQHRLKHRRRILLALLDQRLGGRSKRCGSIIGGNSMHYSLLLGFSQTGEDRQVQNLLGRLVSYRQVHRLIA